MRILSNEIGALDAVAHNWAVQDETVAFLEAPASQYSLSNLTGIDVDIMLLADSSAQIVFSQAFDPQSERPTPMVQSLQRHLANDSPLVHHNSPQSSVAGIVLLPENPLLVASSPVVAAEAEPAILGTLIVGRYLDTHEIERLAEITRSSLTLHRSNDPRMPADYHAAYLSVLEDPICGNQGYRRGTKYQTP